MEYSGYPCGTPTVSPPVVYAWFPAYDVPREEKGEESSLVPMSPDQRPVPVLRCGMDCGPDTGFPNSRDLFLAPLAR